MSAINEIPSGFMKDNQGRLVPLANIEEIDKERDALVREIIAKAKAVSGVLDKFKGETLNDIQAFVELSAEKYGVARGGLKGNVELATYDGEYKVTRAISDVLAFDERILAAKELIDECLHEWTEGSNSNLRAVVNHAFRVDKKGNLNVKNILSLRRVAIVDDKWKRAMAAISDSIQATSTREYIRVYKRDDHGKYAQLNLDVSGV